MRVSYLFNPKRRKKKETLTKNLTFVGLVVGKQPKPLVLNIVGKDNDNDGTN